MHMRFDRDHSKYRQLVKRPGRNADNRAESNAFCVPWRALTSRSMEQVGCDQSRVRPTYIPDLNVVAWGHGTPGLVIDTADVVNWAGYCTVAAGMHPRER